MMCPIRRGGWEICSTVIEINSIVGFLHAPSITLNTNIDSMKRRDFFRNLTIASAVSLYPMAAIATKKAVNWLTAAEYDVIVCGGGPSGISAAVNAARLGAKTLLVERYGRLGGMAVQSLVGPLMGGFESPFVDEVLKRIGGRKPNMAVIDLEYYRLLKEAGVHILLHTWISDTITEGNMVKGIKTLSKDGTREIHGRVIVDATGDGDVASFAGAKFEQGREGDGLVQPMTIMFELGGIENDALICESEEMAHEKMVGSQSWHDMVNEANRSGILPSNVSIIRLYHSFNDSHRFVNATQINYVDGTKAADLTRAEFECRQQALSITEFVKNRVPGYQNAYIARMPPAIGVRETRRVLGEYYLTKNDLTANVKKDDAVVRSANFVIDIHNPDGGGQAKGFAEKVKPYDIPYGCLVPQKIDNLLLAGRCISGSHEAHASYRVQCICMAIGAASGTAAALSAIDRIIPRNLIVSKIQSKLFG